MVPRPELPLTTSGKINRQALERSLDHTVDRPLRQPQNDAERSVLAAFQEVLGMAPLSTDDDFFECLDTGTASCAASSQFLFWTQVG